MSAGLLTGDAIGSYVGRVSAWDDRQAAAQSQRAIRARSLSRRFFCAQISEMVGRVGDRKVAVNLLPLGSESVCQPDTSGRQAFDRAWLRQTSGGQA